MMNKMMKKIAVAFAAATMAIAGTTMITNAAPCERTKYVTASTLSVREQPTVDSAKLGELPHGVDVRVVDTDDFGGWTQIDYNGMRRYVCSAYLSDTKPADSSYSWLKTGSNVATKSDYTVKVDQGYLALRNSPSFDASNEIAHLQNGTQVQLINNGEGTYWTVMIPATGQCGYVNSNYLV